jgi:hypothetical protein
MQPTQALGTFLLTLCLLACLSGTEGNMQQFLEFQRQHGKNYNAHEFTQRYQIFLDNLSKLQRLIQNNPNRDTEFGITPFFDLTPEEFAQQYLIHPSILEDYPDHLQSLPPPPEEERRSWTEPRAIPTAWDWRLFNRTVIGPVQNQGGCGSCWAFSAAEQLESMWALAGKPLVTLSAQQLVDCDRGDSGCGGGWPSRAYNYIKSAGGLETKAAYPYTGRNDACKFNSANIAAKLSSWFSITTARDENVMTNYVATKGPMSVCLDAHTWQYYRSGVITTSSGCGTQLNHCVMVTGYNVTSSGVKVWNVRNQWGTGFGTGGYLLIQRGANVCGIASSPTSVVPAVPNPTPIPPPNPNPVPLPLDIPGTTDSLVDGNSIDGSGLLAGFQNATRATRTHSIKPNSLFPTTTTFGVEFGLDICRCAWR